MHRFVVYCAIAFALLGRGALLHAELILDDFDDPAEVVSPAMLDQFVQTPGVGDLNARRSIRIFGSRADPVGRIDIDAQGSSALVAALDELNSHNSPLSTIVSVQARYEFWTLGIPLSGQDVSESGRNNAIVFDFRKFSSAITPSFFRVIAEDLTGSYEALADPPGPSAQPFSVDIPFESFRLRGGGAGLPDFTSIRSLDITMRVVSGAGPLDLAFRMDLDRIRFARIPEPAGAALAILGLAIVARMRHLGRWS